MLKDFELYLLIILVVSSLLSLMSIIHIHSEHYYGVSIKSYWPFIILLQVSTLVFIFTLIETWNLGIGILGTINTYDIVSYEVKEPGFNGSTYDNLEDTRSILGEDGETYTVYRTTVDKQPNLKSGFYSNLELTNSYRPLTPVGQLLALVTDTELELDLHNIYIDVQSPTIVTQE